MSSGALLKRAKGAQVAKSILLVIETQFSAGRLIVTKENSKKISFLKVSLGGGLLKMAKRALTFQKSYFSP